jgi:hypothetical protein
MNRGRSCRSSGVQEFRSQESGVQESGAQHGAGALEDLRRNSTIGSRTRTISSSRTMMERFARRGASAQLWLQSSSNSNSSSSSVSSKADEAFILLTRTTLSPLVNSQILQLLQLLNS